jgi:hypothetical protein
MIPFKAMVLQSQEAGVFKDELNLHVHLVQYICWQAYILEALQWIICNESPRWKRAIGCVEVGGGLAGSLLRKVCGELWLIYEQH